MRQNNSTYNIHSHLPWTTVACNVNYLRVIFFQLIQLSSPGQQQGISALESRHGAQTHRQLTRPLQSVLLSFKGCPQLYTQRKLWLFSLWWDKAQTIRKEETLLRAASCKDLFRIDQGEISIAQEQETHIFLISIHRSDIWNYTFNMHLSNDIICIRPKQL